MIVEAFADYLRGHAARTDPSLTLEIHSTARRVKTVTIDRANLFTFDNKFVLEGDAVATGSHTLEIRKSGRGPLYFNAYLDYFTLEEFITAAGLEIKVDRKVFRLKEVDKKVKAAGARGQPLDQKVEKYEREPLDNLATLKSGELVEVELTIESKNDYEYLVFEDMKAAGFEPVEVRSGYTRKRARGLRRVPRPEGLLLRAAPRARQAQRQLPPAGRDPGQASAPSRPAPTPCTRPS